MKILHINTNDIFGGAARAAYRLHKGLCQYGIQSKLRVQIKESGDVSVLEKSSKISKGIALARPSIDSLITKISGYHEKSLFSPTFLPNNIHKETIVKNTDIIHLHWICHGYISIKNISQFSKPIVWTIHDMWSFTGGCHYDDNCGKYTRNCGGCPVLDSKKENDLSRRVWRAKKKYFKNLPITIVSPSQWLAACSRKSELFASNRTEVIPNGIDLGKYQMIDKELARKICGLKNDKKYILFGAIDALSDERKGFRVLKSALAKLTQSMQGKMEVVIFGASEPKSPVNLGFKIHYMGNMHDDISLSVLYSAADVMVVPSSQDNLPNTILESMACGTPCITFNLGGMPDAIEHKFNGYLAEKHDTTDFANGIEWLINNENLPKLGEMARKIAVEKFDIKNVTKSYINLYEEILTNTY